MNQFGMVLVAAVLWSPPVASAGISEVVSCRPTGALHRLAALPEASGLAVARGAPDRLWVHNDSGAPVLHALNSKGEAVGRVTLTGARVDDWEALAVGPCGRGSCLFVADIGDNNATRERITIYRVSEPAQLSGAVAAEAFHARYPDGAHDAEALLVAPDGVLLIVTKGDTGPIAVYRFPPELQSGTTMTLERLGEALADKPGADARVTDGAVSADGRWVVLRTRRTLTFYPADAFLRGQFREAHRSDLSALKEPQGEAVAFGAGHTVYVAGEGGGRKQPGTLGALSCKP